MPLVLNLQYNGIFILNPAPSQRFLKQGSDSIPPKACPTFFQLRDLPETSQSGMGCSTELVGISLMIASGAVVTCEMVTSRILGLVFLSDFEILSFCSLCSIDVKSVLLPGGVQKSAKDH